MKQFLLGLFLSTSLLANATETILIASPYSASHSGTGAMYKIIEEANKAQQKYNFIIEFKPGGEQLLAVKYMNEQPANRLSIIAPKYVEHVKSGKLVKDDYVPIHALGDACWAVITNVGSNKIGISSLRGQKELVVGGVGVGNATHITALELADRFGFNVRYVPFKSNFDALILLISDQSVNMVLERVINYQQYREKNKNISVLGMSCPRRHPDLPQVKTLAEQGVDAPYVFNITIAHRDMPAERRAELALILDNATRAVGTEEIYRVSDMMSPVFTKQSTQDYYQARFNFMSRMLDKHEKSFKSN